MHCRRLARRLFRQQMGGRLRRLLAAFEACPLSREFTPIELAAIKMPSGVTMSNLQNAVQELREKRSRSQAEINKLDQIISGIESLNGTGAVHESSRPTRIISAASRRKMALAQKARWASIRKQSQPILVSAPAKRTMSRSARRKIAAAQKARWAKVKAQQKKAA